ncbi:hypothetical protein AWV79_06780 [Cupriavidus sp. UYMMa02A]|nr:hypothetical protein AWV79_06780 [Cupriavidus sp. UYMMa02A]
MSPGYLSRKTLYFGIPAHRYEIVRGPLIFMFAGSVGQGEGFGVNSRPLRLGPLLTGVALVALGRQMASEFQGAAHRFRADQGT